MKTLLILGEWVYDNFMILLAFFVICFGIGLKIYNFSKRSLEEKKRILEEEAHNIIKFIKNAVYDLVVQAEKEYGSGTGMIKRSKVFNALIELIPDLEAYIANGDIDTDLIGDIIDNAVDVINSKIKDDDKSLGEIFNNTKDITIVEE